VVVLSISFSIRYNDNESNSDIAFAPGDTRIISYSSTFCDGLSLSGGYDASSTAELYLLEKKPSLSGPSNDLSVDLYVDLGSYDYYYYYLHPGSMMNLTYCLPGGDTLTFALIKGKSNFNSWKNDRDSSHAIKEITVTNPCSSSSEWYGYTFTSEDTYYFVFDNTGYDQVYLTATLVLNRTEYLPSSVDIYDSCSTFVFTSCSVSVPLNSNYVALLEVADIFVEDDDTLYYDLSCSPRVWIYVLIVVLPLLFVVVTMTLVLIICIILVRKRSQKYANLPTAAATEDAGTTATVGPPPVNNPAPPTYGSTNATIAGVPAPYPH
jgi:hypothetical protein